MTDHWDARELARATTQNQGHNLPERSTYTLNPLKTRTILNSTLTYSRILYIGLLRWKAISAGVSK